MESTATDRFDSAAAKWDEEPRRVQLAREVTDAIIKAVRPTAEMDALDFGCGTGLVTLSLRPHLRTITGLDSSRGMLDALEGKVRESGLAGVTAVLCDMEHGERPAGNYHLVVSSMTLHHVEEIEPLFRLFHDLLVPGGQIAVADLDAEDGTFHDEHAGVHHFGFDRHVVKAALARSGFADIRDSTAAIIRKPGAGTTREYPVFLIAARKQS